MNVLMQAVRERAGALREYAPDEEVPFWELAQLLADDERVGPLLRAIDADPFVAGQLDASFAGVVSVEAWDAERASASARLADAEAVGEWVAMVPVPTREYGITLPEDLAPDARVSLFTRTGEVVRRIGVVALPGPRPALEVRLAGGECGRPYRGRCEGGGTCVECEKLWIARPGEPAGYECRCADDPDPARTAARAHAGVPREYA